MPDDFANSLYAYVGNDPMDQTDPTGTESAGWWNDGEDFATADHDAGLNPANVPGNLKFTGKIGAFVGISLATDFVGDLAWRSRVGVAVRDAIAQLPKTKLLPRLVAAALHFYSSQEVKVAESLKVEVERVLVDEKAGAVQSALESGATDEGSQLEGQAAQKVGQKILKSTTAVTTTGASQEGDQSHADQQNTQVPMGTVLTYHGTDCEPHP